MSSTPPPIDVVLAAWGPVTVRTAFVLQSYGITVKPEVLRDARDHVWFHLPSEATVAVAEDRTEPLVAAYITRARRKVWVPRFPEDAGRELVATWRDRLFRGLSRPAAIVLRHHLADGHALDRLATTTQIDLLTLEAAHEGLRELLRRTAAKDGEDLDEWTDDRLDHFLHRLAVRTRDTSLSLAEVVDGLHPDAVDQCVTASRARSLVRKGALSREDLIPPRVGALPTDRVRVLALHVHPQGKRDLPELLAKAGGRAFPVAGDQVLLDASDVEARRAWLAEAAAAGKPAKDLLCGLVAEGPGRWTKHGLIGPLVDEIPARVAVLPWGQVDGLGDALPEVTPPEPTARREWTLVTALSAVCALLLYAALRAAAPGPALPMDLSVAAAEGGLWIDLDVADEAHLVVVTETAGKLSVVQSGAAIAEKASLAVGDGTYRMRVPGDAVLVASAPKPVVLLPELLAHAGSGPGALERLRTALDAQGELLDVAVARR